MNGDIPILGRPKGGVVVANRNQAKPVIRGRVEICKSFSFKLNVGNYQNVEFFESQKSTCDAADSERVSDALYSFCKSQVLKQVKQYREEVARKPNKGNAAEFEKWRKRA